MDVGPDALAKGQANLKVHIEYTCAHIDIRSGTEQELGFEAPGMAHSTHAAVLPSPKPDHLPLTDCRRPETHMSISLTVS